MPKCCVEGCTDQSKDLRYFNFPTSRLLRRKWIAAIDPDLKPKLSTMVCSRHFLPSDLETARGRMRLRAMAVPSLDNKIQHKEDTNSSEASSISQKVDSPHIDSPPVDSPKLESPEDDGPKVVSPKVGSQSNSSDTDSEVSDTEDEPENNETNIITKVEVTETKVEVRSNVQEKRKNLHDKLKDLQQKRDRINNKIKKFEHEKERELKQEGSGDERVQEREVEGETGTEKSNGQTEGGEENGVGSAPKLPDGPRDIDKTDPEDIEELLTNYQIKQDRPLNIHTVTEDPPEPDVEMAPEPEEKEPVYIEISVDKDKDNVTDKDDCLMVMESVQVELDPSELLLHERDAAPERDGDIDAVEIDDAPPGKEDPISLLTSSDEDDVIIEEPHIDTVEVSDETDEDDMPLGKLLRRRDRRRGRQLNSAPVPAFDPTQVNGETDIAKILWGMYEYYCVQCHYTTSSGSEYRKHTASHAKVLMMCQICGYMTASESQFTKHEKQHGEKKYKCHLCSYKAKHNMSLLYHLKGHKAEDFLKKSEVKNMLKRLPKSRLFECTNCSYTSKKRCDLKRHMTRRHKQDDEEFIP